ncbi:MAG: class I SAM-dependent methyltransferase [Chloroflexia bacterium]
MQSLPASAIVLNLGAGNQALDLANVIRMDVTLTPYSDVVGDAHALPFKPGTFDFIFSQAVIEHLRNPFLAAQEMFDALRNGGYVYGDCNFVFAYHGYPHHYFNASEQGLEEAFSQFEKLRTGVAPYQMPSFALNMVLGTYLNKMGPSDDPQVQVYRDLVQRLLEQPLMNYDVLFTEEAALYVAAGVFFFGRKSVEGLSDVVPQIFQSMWQADAGLQQRYPNIFNLGTFHNILMWAKEYGRHENSEIEAYFQAVVPFRKHDKVNDEDQKRFEATPFFEPEFYAMSDSRPGDLRDTTKEIEELQLTITAQKEGLSQLDEMFRSKNSHIKRLESLIKRLESGRVMKMLGLIERKRKQAISRSKR